MENEAPAYKRGNSKSEQAAHQYFLPAVSMDLLHGHKWDIQPLCHALAQKVQRFGLKPCRSAHAEGVTNDNEPQKNDRMNRELNPSMKAIDADSETTSAEWLEGMPPVFQSMMNAISFA